MRAISDHDSSFIKSQTASSVEAMNGVKAAAKELGVASSTLSKYISPADEWRDSHVRLDLAIAMDRKTGHPFLLEAMKAMVHAEPSVCFGDLTASAILRLDGVLDDVVREIVMAGEDDRYDAAERLAIGNKIVAAQTVLARLHRRIMEMGR